MKMPKVLIIKHGSIGDIFMSLDSVKAIQKKYSDITLLSTNSGHRIFDDSDFNFKKIIDNRRGFFNTCKILSKIISQKFDIVIETIDQDIDAINHRVTLSKHTFIDWFNYHAKL